MLLYVLPPNMKSITVFIQLWLTAVQTSPNTPCSFLCDSSAEDFCPPCSFPWKGSVTLLAGSKRTNELQTPVIISWESERLV